MEPCLDVHGRHVRSIVYIAPLRECAARGEPTHLLSVPLLDHAEPAELSLLPIEVAVVVCVTRNKVVAGDVIEDLDSLDDVYRERQPRDPRPTVESVLNAEPGRRS